MKLSTGTERDYEQAKLLLEEYSFDLGGLSAETLVMIWQERLAVATSWIRAAIIEALYQGRYKAVSVDQILQSWKRRDRPIRHFNSEFERTVFSPIDPTLSQYVPPTRSHTSSDPASPAEVRSTDATANSESADEAVTVPPKNAGDGTQDTAAIAEMTVSPNSTPDASPSAPLRSPFSYSAAMFSQPTPIQKFTPQSEASDFYTRLRAVARSS